MLNIYLLYFVAFTFFADVSMQSFYKRYIRDYMRYKDAIQCAGAELVAAVRADSLKEDPNGIKSILECMTFLLYFFYFQEVGIIMHCTFDEVTFNLKM